MVYEDNQGFNILECLSSAFDVAFKGLLPPFVMVGLNVISLSNNSIPIKNILSAPGHAVSSIIAYFLTRVRLDSQSIHSCTSDSLFKILFNFSLDISLMGNHRCQPKITNFQG